MFANMHSYIPTLNLNASCIKILNFEKEVGVAIKSKETCSQVRSVRNSHVRIAIMH